MACLDCNKYLCLCNICCLMDSAVYMFVDIPGVDIS